MIDYAAQIRRELETLKSPLGIMPKFIVAERRLAEINSAVDRFLVANMEIPEEWITERNELIKYLRSRND